MSVGVPVVPIGTIGDRCPVHRLGRRHGSSPTGPPSPPRGPPWRIPPGPSPAPARTKLLTPPLWNAYAMTPAVPDQPLDEETQTIEPLMPRSAIARPAYLVFRKVPSAETRTARSKASAVSSSTPLPPSR